MDEAIAASRKALIAKDHDRTTACLLSAIEMLNADRPVENRKPGQLLHVPSGKGGKGT